MELLVPRLIGHIRVFLRLSKRELLVHFDVCLGAVFNRLPKAIYWQTVVALSAVGPE